MKNSFTVLKILFGMNSVSLFRILFGIRFLVVSNILFEISLLKNSRDLNLWVNFREWNNWPSLWAFFDFFKCKIVRNFTVRCKLFLRSKFFLLEWYVREWKKRRLKLLPESPIYAILPFLEKYFAQHDLSHQSLMNAAA